MDIPKWAILQGDNRAIMKAIALAVGPVFQTIVTSPPYFGLRSYDVPNSWWGGDDECPHAIVSTYIKPGIDGGANSPKHQIKGRNNFQNVADQRQGWCDDCGAWWGQLGQEPTLAHFITHLVEVFQAARSVLKSDGTLWVNMGDTFAGSGRGQTRAGHSEEHGTKQGTNKGTLVPGIGKAPIPEGMKQGDLMLVPSTMAAALRFDGWHLRHEITWLKPNGFCESVRSRPTRKTERIYLFGKEGKYQYDWEAIAEEAKEAGRAKRNAWDVWDDETLWVINNEANHQQHFASFPRALADRAIRASTRPGDWVLDPFTGIGRAGMAAVASGRRFLGVDIGADYVAGAKYNLECVAEELAAKELPSGLTAVMPV